MDNAARIYCFQLDDDDQVRWPQSFVGRHGSVVKGCHDLAAVLTFTTLAQANDFHMQSRGVFAGRILRLRCYLVERDDLPFIASHVSKPQTSRGGGAMTAMG